MFSVGASCPVSSHRRMSLSSAWLGSGSSTAIRQFRFPDSTLKGARRNYICKEKAEYFGVDLKTDLTVDTDKVRPCSKIKGELEIFTKFPIEHDGIFVQLEAFCCLNYITKLNERISTHKGKGCILENTKINQLGNFESPIKCEIIPITPPEFGGHSINSGVWHYPFELQIPGNPLPTKWDDPKFGSLDYRLVVYMISHSSATYIKLLEKNMECEGYFNLIDDEESSKEISQTISKKSYFSQKKQIKAIFSVKTTGFLQHEEIPFSLLVKSKCAVPLILSVTLQKHVKYQATTNLASLVKIVTTIESLEKDESDEPKPEIHWAANIRVPESQAPTYSCNSMYSVNYFLEFQVKSPDEEVILTGQARILLGTTRDPIKVQESSSEDCSGALPQPGELVRSGSESSIHSQRSIYSTPIAYSVPANLNLSIDEPDEDEDDNDQQQQQQQNEGEPSSSSSCHLRPSNSPSPRHHRSQSHHDITETVQEESEEVIEPFSSAPYTSVNSLLSTQTVLTLPPSYSTLSSRIASIETLPPTYADLDLNVGPPASLMIGDAVDLEKRYSINLDTLNLQDEYQVTFYSV